MVDEIETLDSAAMGMVPFEKADGSSCPGIEESVTLLESAERGTKPLDAMTALEDEIEPETTREPLAVMLDVAKVVALFDSVEYIDENVTRGKIAGMS